MRSAYKGLSTQEQGMVTKNERNNVKQLPVADHVGMVLDEAAID